MPSAKELFEENLRMLGPADSVPLERQYPPP